jgi:hypothetical protein
VLLQKVLCSKKAGASAVSELCQNPIRFWPLGLGFRGDNRQPLSKELAGNPDRNWPVWPWMPSGWREPQKPWAKKSPKTNVIARNLPMFFLCYGPCISAWIEPGILLRAEEPVGRTGKQPDGSAKTGEVKL